MKIHTLFLLFLTVGPFTSGYLLAERDPYESLKKLPPDGPDVTSEGIPKQPEITHPPS